MKINDPRFNLREQVKQLILLEQHLLEKGKYCPDCITKHLLSIEGLADEGQCLDTDQTFCGLFEVIRRNAQRWCQMFSRGVAPHAIGQEVRQLRKKLAQHVLDPGYGSTTLALANPEPYTTSNTNKIVVPLAIATVLYLAFNKNAREALIDFARNPGGDE